jgi:hypothetical protein
MDFDDKRILQRFEGDLRESDSWNYMKDDDWSGPQLPEDEYRTGPRQTGTA